MTPPILPYRTPQHRARPSAVGRLVVRTLCWSAGVVLLLFTVGLAIAFFALAQRGAETCAAPACLLGAIATLLAAVYLCDRGASD